MRCKQWKNSGAGTKSKCSCHVTVPNWCVRTQKTQKCAKPAVHISGLAIIYKYKFTHVGALVGYERLFFLTNWICMNATFLV